MIKALIISGSTGSGKSDLAHYFADCIDAELINADSVQLYEGFDIGSAKPDSAILKKYKYNLIDVAKADRPWDVAKYRKELMPLLESSKQKTKIIIGGTTLYLKGVLCGLIDLEVANPILRANLEAADLEVLNLEYNQIYQNQIPKRRVNPNDRVRLIRSIEIYKQTGKTKEELIANQKAPDLSALIILPIWSREQLYARINQRTQFMLDQDLIEETKNLLCLYSENLSIFRSIGYAQAVNFLSGKIAEIDLLAEISQSTRRYAKRQMTFWRNEPPKNNWGKYPTRKIYPQIELEGFQCIKIQGSDLLSEVAQFYENDSNGIHILPIDANFLVTTHGIKN